MNKHFFFRKGDFFKWHKAYIECREYLKIFRYYYSEKRRKEVELFDIKAIVNKIREEKMNSLMSGMGEENVPSFPGLFGPQPKSESSFNVEDLVSKIDARIAELEEEERREKEAQEKAKEEKDDEKQSFVSSDNDVTDDQFFDDFFDD